MTRVNSCILLYAVDEHNNYKYRSGIIIIITIVVVVVVTCFSETETNYAILVERGYDEIQEW